MLMVALVLMLKFAPQIHDVDVDVDVVGEFAPQIIT